MHDKKTQLILSAIRLFGERDYHSTSVQDIVTLAGVSKGAFYQHFQSKEELLVSIYRHYFDRLHNELQEAQTSGEFTTRELLVKAIELQCRIIFENKDFLCMMVNGTAFTEVIRELMVANALQTIKWFQERIIEMYGPDLEPHSLDCASMLTGAVKEYFFCHIFYRYDMDSLKVANYLIDRLDDVAAGIKLKTPQPILDASLGQSKPVLQIENKPLEAQIELIKAWMKRHVKDEQTAAAVLQSLDAIVDELRKEACNGIILQGMYSYCKTLAREEQTLLDLLQQTFANRIPGAC
ncbi:TetR/AcrR family transcriptional regulator [Paenibacillus sp. y28]|uniref:TetR/AcrR family transcriptional regulator n=1 Tax=Paenibacillus sp. y28 TaxID=3129110 RepID=UPI003015E0E1